MGHHNHSHNRVEKAFSDSMLLVFALNLIFACIETAGGLFTNSVSILSDAIHDFGDAAAIGLAYYLQKVSLRKPDKNHTYGYKRYSLLGSVLISLVLLVSSGIIISEGINRVINPQDVKSGGMLVFAIIGIVVNGVAMFRLKGSESLNHRAVFLHMMEDVLGWIAVLIVAVVLQFIYLPVLDPILSILIALWVIFNVYRNLKSSLNILMQQVPIGTDVSEIISEISKIQFVNDVHDFHLWSMDGETNIASMHVVVSKIDNCPPEQILKIKNEIKEICSKKGIEHTTIETEYLGDVCSTNCY